MNYKHFFFIILSLFFLYSKTQSIDQKIFNDSFILPKINISSFNLTNLTDICDSFEKSCYSQVTHIINNFTLHFNPESIFYLSKNPSSLITKIISESYFYYGVYNYYGINEIKTDLEVALSSFIISSYLGNSKSHFKIYILISTDLINHIIHSPAFTKLLKKNTVLNTISKQKFYKNFNYTDNSESFSNSIAIQFLFSSALDKYYPALLTLGYQFSKGILVKKNIQNAINYYKLSSLYSINALFNQTIFFYYHNIISLEKYEYVKNKFDAKDGLYMKVDELIDEYKTTQIQKTKLKYISEIGLRYLLGVGTDRIYEEALKWFELGASKEDASSYYYLGEIYLNGLGLDINYQKAYEYYMKAANNKYVQAYNSLGYMYYFGLYVEKDVNKAYQYFRMANEKTLDNEGMYSIITYLLDDTIPHNDWKSENKNEGVIDEKNEDEYKIDIELAYMYANFISLRKHRFGTYFFAMMNYYKFLENYTVTDEVILRHFKYVSERFYEVYFIFNYANKLYLEKKYQNALLIYLELAEQGIDKGIINTGILLKKYKIFKNKKYQNYLFFKYTERASEDIKDLYSMLNLGDYYYSKGNYSKALHYYLNVVNEGDNKNNHLKDSKQNKFNFYIANGLFNLGYMTNFKIGTQKNNKTNYLFNTAEQYEHSVKFPIRIVKMINMLNNFINHGKIVDVLLNAIYKFFKDKWNIIAFIFFFVFYIYFLIEIYLQK